MKFMFALMSVLISFSVMAELKVNVHTKPYNKLWSDDNVVTNVTITGTAGVETNEVKAIAGEVATNVVNEAKADLMPKVTAPVEDNLASVKADGTVGNSGIAKSDVPSKATMETELNKKMPKWLKSEAEALPVVEDSDAPEKLIEGYKKMRQFLIDNGMES